MELLCKLSNLYFSFIVFKGIDEFGDFNLFSVIMNPKIRMKFHSAVKPQPRDYISNIEILYKKMPHIPVRVKLHLPKIARGGF